MVVVVVCTVVTLFVGPNECKLITCLFAKTLFFQKSNHQTQLSGYISPPQPIDNPHICLSLIPYDSSGLIQDECKRASRQYPLGRYAMPFIALSDANNSNTPSHSFQMPIRVKMPPKSSRLPPMIAMCAKIGFSPFSTSFVDPSFPCSPSTC